MKAIEVLNKVLNGKRVSDARRTTYRQAFRCWMAFCDDWPETPAQVNEWVAQMPKEYSDETVLTYFNAILAAGNYMQRSLGRNADGKPRFFNIVTDADVPSVEKKQRRYYKGSEMMDYLKACRGMREIALVSVIIESCCRIGDLVGLKVSDINLEAGTFDSRKGKTGHLIYHCDSRILRQLVAIANLKTGVVFNMKRYPDNPASVACLKQEIRNISKRAGISGRKIGPHTLRHSGASLIAKTTKSALVVMEKLQHTKMETSMEYIHDADTLAEGISPMSMISVKPADVSQLTLNAGEVVEDYVVVENDLVDEMFDKIPGSVEIRPRLGVGDLGILRSIMVDFARTFRGDSRIYECQVLLKRMLRKVI